MTGISIEAIADHDTTGITALAGHTTYRFYATLTNPTDRISAVYGDASAPLTLTSSDGFFNATFGGDFGLDVNPALFSYFLETAYDSWFTIGFAPGDYPLSNLTAVGLAPQLTAFNATGQIDLSDAVGGSYFTTDDPHAVAGEDLKVLLGQLTTSGSFTGVFNAQVFVEGSASNEQLMEGVVFSDAGVPDYGCTDPEAENYDPDAAVDDGSCVYPCSISLSGTAVDASCPGGDDGEITLTVTGAQFEVFFGLDGAYPDQLLGHFVGLEVGDHTAVALDGAGCLDTLQFSIEGPEPFALEATAVAAICEGEGGALTLTATGGTAPYTYSLGGETNSYGAFAIVPPGTHVVTLTDALGCTEDISVEVVGISEAVANPLASASCTAPASGSVELLLNGNPAEGIEWLSGLSGSDMNESGIVEELTPGEYVAVLTSGTCADTVEWTVDLEIDLDDFTAEASNATCAGYADGSVQFSGPDETWTVAWGAQSEPWSSDGILGLAAGEYSFTVSSVPLCSVAFDVTVQAPDPLIWSVSTNDPLCDGDATGSMSVSLSGGTLPWIWSINGAESQAFSGSEQLTNLNSGTYSIHAEDANGCVAETNAMIGWPTPVASPEALVIAPTTYANGSATALVDPSFDIAWTDAAGNLLGTETTLTGLHASNITLTSTNAEGCSASTEVLIPFAGCSAIGASDWPEEASGWYPTYLSIVETDVPFSLEWVLQLPASVTPPTANISLPVTSFLPESISGLPEGVTATADFSQAIPVSDAWCMELNGSAAAGTYPVVVSGTFYIEFFGSIFPAPGFTYMKALIVEDFVPETTNEGCTYEWAVNFDPSAAFDDGSCQIAGCMVVGACNFQPLATQESACDFSCLGCTYSDAVNFDSEATSDDGSCQFPPSGDGDCCPWDGDGNGFINSNDLLMFLGAYNTACE